MSLANGEAIAILRKKSDLSLSEYSTASMLGGVVETKVSTQVNMLSVHKYSVCMRHLKAY